MRHSRNTCLALGLTLVLGTSASAQERDVDGWMESANSILGGAVEVGDRLWLSSTGAYWVAIFDLEP
jgi:hypothetical protein